MSVTVCIPVYNRFEYVDEAIGSVREQTAPPLELLIVDDGSEPPYVNGDERVVRVSHRGPQNAWNTALMLAQGEWFLPLASDDQLEPDFIAKALAASKDADAVVVTMRQFGDSNGLHEPRTLTLDEVWTRNEYPYCALYRTATLRQLGGWHGMLPRVPDWAMWIDLTRRDARITTAPAAVFNYRVHNGSHTASLTAADRVDDIAALREFFP